MTTPPLSPRWVASADEAAVTCADARSAGRVAVDTEADSLHSYFHKLCLVQLSWDDRHVLLDPLALGRPGLAPLAALLADGAVVKLMHGSDYDMRVFDRDLGARVVNLRDTQVAAQLLGEPRTGLGALLEKELGLTLDKRFQRADWGRRPLGAELLAYAAADTAYLDRLTALIESRLEALGRRHWWIEECEALEQVRFEPPVPDPFAFERIKGARALRGVARDRLAALHAWREEAAAADDVPPFHVARSETLLAMAQAPPADLAALGAVAGLPRGTVRRHGRTLLGLLAQPPAGPPREDRARFKVDRVREGRIKALREARDAVAAGLGIEPGLLAPRGAVELVADTLPAGEGELRRALCRRWRTEVLAPVLLPLVAPWRSG